MADFMTTTEASRRWGISSRRINTLCAEGRLPGAYKTKKTWMIPANAEKPADKRYKTTVPNVSGEAEVDYRYKLKSSTIEKLIAENIVYQANKKLPLPIGISDYKKASSEYYYVDKTLMIRDFIDERPQVSLFTRPRRFGKTLNMDMLRVFFEKTEEDTSVYFRDKKIWLCGEEYQAYQGKYPVIFVTFKDVKFQTWEETYVSIREIFSNEAIRHVELLDSDKCSVYDKAFFEKIVAKELNTVELSSVFVNLSRMLHMHHGIAPIIIIDEYDIPIQQGYMNGFYDEVVLFVRNLFSGGLKDNPHLSFGFLTGILRVAKESIFSGLNNVKINSILDDAYSQYFGFTPEEVRDMVAYYGAADKYQELCEWYDGYRFGKTEIFNPWSVIGYFNNACEPKAFWVSTGSNDIIGEALKEADSDIYERLEALMKGQAFVSYVDTGVIYPQIKKNPSSIYSFLLMTGYLKVVGDRQPFGTEYMCELALPNKEIASVYSREILSQLEDAIPMSTSIALQEALFKMDIEALQKKIQDFLLQTVSFYDTTNENFYHGLVLGLCAMMDNHYRVTSNRESGKGRYDIQLMPKKGKLPGVLIELKAESHGTEEHLKQLSKEALKQINDKRYDVDMKSRGIEIICKYGVAFCGKDVEISCEIE